jgi:type II secretion system protein C
METLLRRYFWTIDLAVIAACCTCLGLAASALVAMNLAGARSAASVTGRTAAKSGAPPASPKSLQATLDRNMFCSGCRPAQDVASTALEAGEAQTVTRTALPLALLGTMCAPSPAQGRWSMAIVKDTESKWVGALVVGGRIRGARIARIAETRILLERGGRTEYLDLFEAGALPAVRSPAPNEPSARGIAATLDRGIRKVAERKYEIDRKVLDSALENVRMLSQSVRPVPEVRGGKMIGFRLYGVASDGFLAKLGLQSGDILSGVNGLELASPAMVMEAYAKLKSASHLSVTFERAGRKATTEYEIR